MKRLVYEYSAIVDRIITYKDFTISLLYCIFHYYLDEQTLNESEDIKNHFMFCYNKVCDNYKKEGFDFSDNKKLIEFFMVYYYHNLYKSKINIPFNKHLKHFNKIFQIDKNNKLLLELYNKFDQSLNKEEKNLIKV